MLGYRHSKIIKLKFGDLHRGKLYKIIFKAKNKRIVTNETRNELKLRSRGAFVCIYDKNLNLIK